MPCPPSTDRPLTKADPRRLGLWHLAFATGFVLLATMNAAGYRYAASDQAFYIPAVLRHLDPRLFPRDAALIDAQARVIAVDEILAGTVRLTGASLQHVFLVLYLVGLVLTYAGSMWIGARLYRTRWAPVALAAAMTLRHAIAKTGANTLEPYFHPRQLAFGFGLLAAGAWLDRRWRLAAVLVAIAAFLHPTTAAWFVIWLGTASWARTPKHRLRTALAAAAGAILVAALLTGPLAGRFGVMDAAWLAAIGPKDLFPLDWPANVWVTNLISLPIIAAAWHRRRAAGLLVQGETALVAGAVALVAVFLCWLPFNAAHVALAVQLQLARVFWLLDFLGAAYLVWFLAEAPTPGARRAALAAAALGLASLARGAYSGFLEFPGRPLFAVDVQQRDWREAMAFVRASDPSSGWLADPLHAAKYGASLRAAGQRDVLVEQIKDHALAIYDRGAAMRLADRERALAAVSWNTPDGARLLAQRFNLDYLVIDRELDLPLAHRSGSLFIYRLH